MLRGFTDSTGVEWRVWEVFPATAATHRASGSPKGDALTQAKIKDTAFAQGWLCFESTAEKRRLAPIPTGWEFHEPSALEQLRDQATVVPHRQRSFGAG